MFGSRFVTVINRPTTLYFIGFVAMPTVMSFEDTQAVVSGLFALGATSFGLSTAVSLISMTDGYFMNPEDAVWCRIPPFSFVIPPAEKLKIGSTSVPDMVQRAKNAHKNHTENMCLLGAFYLVYYFSNANDPVARIMIAVSAAMRVAYGPLYIFGMAPWRTIAHLVAQMAGLYVGFVGYSAMTFSSD